MTEIVKKSYEVLKPVLIGDRKEVGETIELTEEEAKNIGDEYVKEVGSEGGDKETTPDDDDKNDDDETNKGLEEALEKSVEDLNDEEKILIKENADGLSDEQKETYKTVIEEEVN